MEDANLLLVNVGIGSIFLFHGVILTVVPFINGSWRRLPELPAFGAGMLLFAFLEVSNVPYIRAAVSLPAPTWEYLTLLTIYFLPVPTFLFNAFFFGPGLWGSYNHVWRVQLLFIAVALTYGATAGNPAALLPIHLTLAVVYLVVITVNALAGYMHTPETGNLIRNASLFMVVTTAHDTLVLSGAIWDVRLMRAGVLTIMAAMAYALLRRVSGNQRQLAALNGELRAARKIQQALLPREAPKLSNDAYSARYLPTNAVGGDFYDLLAPSPDGFGILIADVTGHGIPAALLASMVKTAAGAQLHHADRPGEVITGMNERLCGSLDDNFVTAAYAYIDLTTSRLLTANGGHPPVLVHHRTTGTASFVPGHGPVLGLFPDEHYPGTEVALEPGDRIVLYSDGLTEAAAPEGEMFSERRLERVVLDNPVLRPTELCDAILSALVAWTRQPTLSLEDDLTLITMEMPDTE